jgi:hypothetical protein
MGSFLYDCQEIFFLVYSPCWTVLLAFVIAGGVGEAARRVVTAIWKRQRGGNLAQGGGDE